MRMTAVARRLSLRMSRAAVETSKLIVKLFSPSVSHTIPVFLYQSIAYDNIPTEWTLNVRWVLKNCKFWPISRFISEMIQYRAMVTMERQEEVICNLSNGAFSNDLEWPLTQISRSRHYLTLSISYTLRDKHAYTSYSKLSFRMILSDFERSSVTWWSVARSLCGSRASCATLQDRYRIRNCGKLREAKPFSVRFRKSMTHLVRTAESDLRQFNSASRRQGNVPSTSSRQRAEHGNDMPW